MRICFLPFSVLFCRFEPNISASLFLEIQLKEQTVTFIKLFFPELWSNKLCKIANSLAFTFAYLKYIVSAVRFTWFFFVCSLVCLCFMVWFMGNFEVKASIRLFLQSYYRNWFEKKTLLLLLVPLIITNILQTMVFQLHRRRRRCHHIDVSLIIWFCFFFFF